MCLLGGGDVTIIRARFEGNVLRPLKKLDLWEGEEVEIELKKGPVEDFHGRLNLSKEVAEEIIGMELWD